MLVWKDVPSNGPLIPGHYYLVNYHLPFGINEFSRELLTYTIKTTADLQHNVTIQQVNYVGVVDSGGKAAGTDVKITFLALASKATTQAGFDIQAVLFILGGVILTILAANGTLKQFAQAVDTTAGAAKNLTSPVGLIALIVLALIVIPLFRGGIK